MIKAKLYSSTGLVCIAVAFVLFCVLMGGVFKGSRIDLTEQKLYTVSKGTQQLLENLPQPLELKFFYSEKAISDVPEYQGFLGQYAANVKELLQKYVYHANGKLTLSVIDPEPFSEAEDQAVENGIQAVPIKNGYEQFYLGLSVYDPAQDEDVSIAFLDPEKEATLEYDITRLIYQVTHPQKPVVGVISGLAMQGSFDYTTGRPTRGWMMYDQLQQFYDVKMLGVNNLQIGADIDLLWVAYPKTLDEQALYAIDQYVLAGGKVIFVVDPFAESEHQMANPMMPPSDTGAADVSKLFDAWGIAYDPQKVVLDRALGVEVPLGPGQPPRKVMSILAVPKQNINDSDVSTALLDNLYFSSVGALSPKEGATTHFESLVLSSADSMLIDKTKIENPLNLPSVQREFVADEQQYTLIARVSGAVKSAFEHAPVKQETANKEHSDEEEQADADAATTSESKSALAADATTQEQDHAQSQEESKLTASATHADDQKPPHRTASQQDINVVVIADSDFLSDRMWVQVQEFFGQSLLNVFAHNGNLMLNSVDNMTGAGELIGLRSRNKYARPLTKFHELRQTAEKTLLEKEVALNQKLEDTQRQLNELQVQKKEGEADNLTPEQVQAIEQFQKEMVETRKALRTVRHQLEQDIDQLKLNIKLVNIAGMPLLLVLLAIVLVWTKRRR